MFRIAWAAAKAFLGGKTLWATGALLLFSLFVIYKVHVSTAAEAKFQEAEVARLEASLASLQDAYRKLRQSCHTQRMDQNQSVDRLSTQVETLSARNDELAARWASASARATRAKRQYEDMQSMPKVRTVEVDGGDCLAVSRETERVLRVRF